MLQVDPTAFSRDDTNGAYTYPTHTLDSCNQQINQAIANTSTDNIQSDIQMIELDTPKNNLLDISTPKKVNHDDDKMETQESFQNDVANVTVEPPSKKKKLSYCKCTQQEKVICIYYF